MSVRHNYTSRYVFSTSASVVSPITSIQYQSVSWRPPVAFGARHIPAEGRRHKQSGSDDSLEGGAREEVSDCMRIHHTVHTFAREKATIAGFVLAQRFSSNTF